VWSAGDVPVPQGGMRPIISSKADYWWRQLKPGSVSISRLQAGIPPNLAGLKSPAE
jgi:hypothetical protein